VIRSCEADEQLETLLSGTKSWDDKTRGGLMTSKRNYGKEEVICDRQQSVSKTGSSGRNRSMQLHRRQVKTDKKKGENTNVYLYFVLNICKLYNVSNYSSLAVTPTKTLVCHRNAKLAIRIMS